MSERVRRRFAGQACVVVAALVVAAWTLHAPRARAEDRITLQARLTQDGVPLHVDLADVEFRLHASESGGTALWSEAHGSVAVRNGLLAVELGASESVAQALDGSPRWVAIVQDGVEITPRIRLTAVPHALRATSASVASGLWSPGGTVTFTALAGDGLEVNGTAIRVSPGFGVAVSGGTVAVDTSVLVGAGADALVGDSMRVQYTPANYAATAANLAGHLEGIDEELATGGGGGFDASSAVHLSPGGRLSASATDAVVAFDVSVVSSQVHYLPYRHDRIPLWDGSVWRSRSVGGGVSLTLSGLSADTNYDVFARWDGQDVVLEAGVAWTASTVRATGSGGLSTLDGIHVKGDAGSQDAARRYVGTIRTTTSGWTEDSSRRRFVWNLDNAVWQHSVTGAYAEWTVNTSFVLTPFNAGDSTWNHELVIGLSRDALFGGTLLGFYQASGNWVAVGVGIHLNGTYRELGRVSIAVPSHFAGVEASAWGSIVPESGYHTLKSHHYSGAAVTAFSGGKMRSVSRR